MDLHTLTRAYVHKQVPTKKHVPAYIDQILSHKFNSTFNDCKLIFLIAEKLKII